MANGHTTPEHTHERSSISISLLRNYVAALAVGTLILLGVVALYWRFLSTVDPQKPSLSLWAGPRELPPSPRLQSSPDTDLRTYLEQQRAAQREYLWADQKSGTVRIPIDRAMSVLVERGVPYRSLGNNAPAQQERRSPNAPAVP